MIQRFFSDDQSALDWKHHRKENDLIDFCDDVLTISNGFSDWCSIKFNVNRETYKSEVNTLLSLQQNGDIGNNGSNLHASYYNNSINRSNENANYNYIGSLHSLRYCILLPLECSENFIGMLCFPCIDTWVVSPHNIQIMLIQLQHYHIHHK